MSLIKTIRRIFPSVYSAHTMGTIWIMPIEEKKSITVFKQILNEYGITNYNSLQFLALIKAIESTPDFANSIKEKLDVQRVMIVKDPSAVYETLSEPREMWPYLDLWRHDTRIPPRFIRTLYRT